MKGFFKCLIVRMVLVCFILSLYGSAQEKYTFSAEEKQKVLQLVRYLESNPLNKKAKDVRKAVLAWVIEVPDITITACQAFLEPLVKADRNYSAELFAQMIFSAAAFVIDYPDAETNEFAKYLAGLEGALKTYESILNEEPSARWLFLDDLLKIRNDGKLNLYVKEKMKECDAQ